MIARLRHLMAALRAGWFVLRGYTVVANAELGPDPLLRVLGRKALIYRASFWGRGSETAIAGPRYVWGTSPTEKALGVTEDGRLS